MRHAGRAGPLVEVIDILGHDLHIVALLEAGDGLVGRIGTRGKHLVPPLVVEFDDQGPVARQRLGRADILDPVVGPQAVRVAEGRQTAVGTHSGTGENHDSLHVRKHFFVKQR